MTAIATSQARVDRQSCRTARTELQQEFEAAFELYVWDQRWLRVVNDGDAGEPADDALAKQLDAVRQAGAQPVCGPATGRATRLLIPLAHPLPYPLVATAVFDQAPPHLLCRLAALYLERRENRSELEQLRNQNEAFLHQVTNDFEELTFLRSVSHLLEISDLKFDFVAMGEKMLGTLLPLLETKTLVMILESDLTHSATDHGGQYIEARRWCGQREVSDDTCCRLVERFRHLATNQPVVKNHFEVSQHGESFPGVSSFILVPIVSVGTTKGWLLALNRDDVRSFKTADLPWEISYLEFGTHEATLMSCSAAILATHARNVELFREREDLLVQVVRALVIAIEAKDEYTCGHSERVALYARRLAEELGYDQNFCERLFLTGLLHDIGKIGVRDAVLRKPGPLTDEEFEEIKQHPDKGWQILHDLKPLHYVLEGVLHHHEQYDGRGYPDQLAGLGIPVHGRILAICDAYDAMTSDRPYRTGMPQEKAESLLRSGSGRQWDPELIDAFFRCMPDILATKNSYQRRAPQRRVRTLSAVEQSA